MAEPEMSFIREALDSMFQNVSKTGSSLVSITLGNLRCFVPYRLLSQHAKFFKVTPFDHYDLTDSVSYEGFRNFLEYTFTGGFKVSDDLDCAETDLITACELAIDFGAREYHDYAISWLFNMYIYENKPISPFIAMRCMRLAGSKLPALVEDLIMAEWHGIIDASDPDWKRFFDQQPAFRDRLLVNLGTNHCTDRYTFEKMDYCLDSVESGSMTALSALQQKSNNVIESTTNKTRK